MLSNIYPAEPGTLISTPTHLVYRHFGIVTEHGLVISNSARRGGVAEETLAAFCNGKDWRIEPRPSAMAWWAVLECARRQSGRPYNLFNWNCESFVNSCYGVTPRSGQVAMSVAIAAVAVIAVASASRG